MLSSRWIVLLANYNGNLEMLPTGSVEIKSGQIWEVQFHRNLKHPPKVSFIVTYQTIDQNMRTYYLQSGDRFMVSHFDSVRNAWCILHWGRKCYTWPEQIDLICRLIKD